MGVPEQTTPLAPGPTRKYTLGTGQDSFEAIGKLIAEHGDLVFLHSADRASPSLICAAPAGVKRVLVTNAANYVKGVGFERVKMLLGNGIIVSDGPRWRRQRTMIQPGFSRANIARMTGIMHRCNDVLRCAWLDIADGPGRVDLTAAMSHYALEVILRAIFGADYELLDAMPGGNPFAFLTTDPTRDLAVAMRFRKLRGLMKDIVDRRRAANDSSFDFLSRLITARERKTGAAMTDAELLDEVMTLIIAGHETTAGTLNWMWYLLSRHREVERALLEEIRAQGAQGEVSLEKLEELPLSRHVVEEALRLYPPVWVFTRKALAQDTVGGFRVPAGTDIFIPPYFIHRHKRFWDEPEAFRPGRFADEAVRARNRYAFIPFSAGARRCIGEYFSLIEMQLQLVALLPCFTLKPAPDLRPELEPGVNLRTRYPITMQIDRRGRAST